MNILITGGSGFFGRSLKEKISKYHNVYAPNHQELDLLNLDKLKEFIKTHDIECVINPAVVIARLSNKLNAQKLYTNLLMFENIICAARDCKYFFSFASAAELGEYPIKDIDLAKESDLLNIVTPEYGGFAKAMIAKRMASIQHPICYNLRIAGCFGKHEFADRFIKANLLRAIYNQPLIVHQNKYMDFIYMEDIINIVLYIINNPDVPHDINCAYTKKYTLLDIAHIILQTAVNKDLPIIIQNEVGGKSYTLDNTILQQLNIPLIGLEQGILDMFNTLKRDYNMGFLTCLANQYQLDKGTLLPEQTSWYNKDNPLNIMGYTTIYEELLNTKRNTVKKMMEIGVYDKRFPGKSLKMWYEYFPNAKIWGVDNFWSDVDIDGNETIPDISPMENERTKIYIADQSNRCKMNQLFKEAGSDFDVIIEDGAHWPSHIMITVATCLPHLKSGGYFFIEDLQSQNGGCLDAYDNVQITQLFQEYIATGILRKLYITDNEHKYLLDNIKSIRMFPALPKTQNGITKYNLVCIEKK